MTLADLPTIIPAFGVLALLFTWWKTKEINNAPEGTARMGKIAKSIQEGAMAFLKAEYKILLWFVVGVAVLLYWSGSTNDPESQGMIAVAFVVGAVCSALAGYLGMKVATKANVRTANAAQESLGKALEVAFAGGSVMGLGVVGLGILGLGGLFAYFGNHFDAFGPGKSLGTTLSVLTGFSFGASSIALFARVGGGIYTKAADVGADLVGKVEAGIPEDHPLNPATIADNVGDNVGDVAGMGADLFESYVGSIIGTMILGAAMVAAAGQSFTDNLAGLSPVLLPLVLGAIGIVTSILGTFLVKVRDGGDPHKALNAGEFASSFAMIVAAYFVIGKLLPVEWVSGGKEYSADGVFYAIIIGLIAGLAIGKITEHYTGTGTKPVRSIVDQSVTGYATNIISGLGVGMISTTFPIIILAVAVVGAYEFAGLYGIAIAAVGMLSNTGIQLAVDAYGPISDNAGGIAEMSELPSEVRQRTDKLDAVGNTTAAIGKGFAIGSAALTALALFAAFKVEANITVIDVSAPKVMAGLFIGAMLPFLFSALAMGAVGRAAMAMIQEVRRQFKNIPALKTALEVMQCNEGKPTEEWTDEERKQFDEAIDSAEYGKCVEISTQSAIKEMIAPGLVAILTPVVIGLGGEHFFPGSGAVMLGGLLAGVTASGVLMALFQSNAGGAWDNAKKMVEEGYEINGEIHGKGSDIHKATVVGDTVGDPLKDTSGPSLNILLKLMSVVALVLAPFIKVP
ncbi:MAG: sodium-translocating pyrophosphatase [Opitutae bacterium]|nr:sodium-translocating pyrophosphatase [Opitutae bacterium]|tara:strand:+ start:1075 stop:3291 length:2217 start_codon:yes stop_codon:yes gene_type:complete